MPLRLAGRSELSSTCLFRLRDAPSPQPTGRQRSRSVAGVPSREAPAQPNHIRKKSGELVRPILRRSTWPGTPEVTPKAVHFDSSNQICYFQSSDSPLDASPERRSIPKPSWEGQTHRSSADDACRWTILTSSLPKPSPEREEKAVALERLLLSGDQRYLFGTVTVANLAYKKYVACRFTFDNWDTVHETAATYLCGTGSVRGYSNRDRFVFSVPLPSATMRCDRICYFCLRYRVDDGRGGDYWDNNGGANFRVDLHLDDGWRLGVGG